MRRQNGIHAGRVRSDGERTRHYEAPKAEHFDREMKSFLEWFEGDKAIDQVLTAGFAHLWFVTIHPFDDRSRGH